MTERPPTGASRRCAVCGLDEPEARLLQGCFQCGRTFHLNPRNDVEGLDCGDAWIGETLGVHFYCQTCIDAMDAEERISHGDMGASQAAAGPGGASTPPPSPAPPDGPPPRRVRPPRRRRYRRIDGS